MGQSLKTEGSVSPKSKKPKLKLPQLSDRQQSELHNSQRFKKKKLFSNWFLSPKQFSQRCKLIEQKSKPSQQRDKNFQDERTVKDIIKEIVVRYKVKDDEFKRSISNVERKSGIDLLKNQSTLRKF